MSCPLVIMSSLVSPLLGEVLGGLVITPHMDGSQVPSHKSRPIYRHTNV